MKTTVAAFVVSLVVLVLGAGCTSGIATHLAPATTVNQAQLYTAWATCVRQHGGTEPDPTFDAQGRPQWQVPLNRIPAAQWQACHSLWHQAQAAAPRQAVDTATLQMRVRYSQCMRQHGLDFPDPSSNGEWDKGYIASHNDTSAPSWSAANQACLNS